MGDRYAWIDDNIRISKEVTAHRLGSFTAEPNLKIGGELPIDETRRYPLLSVLVFDG
jgi:hypothetical protein